MSGRVEGGGRGSGLIIFFHIIVEMVGHYKHSGDFKGSVREK